MTKKRVSLDEFMDEATKPTRKPIKKKRVAISVRHKRVPMKRSPLIIVKKEPAKEDINKWLATKPGFIEGLTETDGSPTSLYAYQINYLIDANPFKHIDKSRQCLPMGSMVNTPVGPVEIENLNIGDLIYSYNIKNDKVEIDEVSDIWESGIRKCEQFLTRAGNQLIAGKNHPFLMSDLSWRKNKNINKGDKFKNCCGVFGSISPEDHIVILLAYFMTDGSTVIQPKFTNNNVELVNEFMDSIHELDSSLEFRICEKGNALEVFPHAAHGTHEKNLVHNLVEKWNLRWKRKESKELPSEVFSWDKDAIALLINRIFACDGWYSRPEGKVLGVGFGTSNRIFAYQVQQLLWNFGIDSRVRHTTHAGPDIKHGYIRDFWKVIIGYRGAVKKFYNEIGIKGKQETPLKKRKHRTKVNDRIMKSKEDIGSLRCFDIAVKKNKNFIFEGFIVHNTGFSYIFAAEGVAEAHLARRHTEIFISINQEEANEKIVYARAMYESMPLAYQKRLVVDNKKSLEFEGQAGKGRTRIISHAQREPRGKGGNTKIILDEAAHYTFGDAIYVAAMPIISRGHGGITIGSTPLGKSGIHWEVMNNPAFKDIYSYYQVYWWDCPEFVGEGLFEEAQKYAPAMKTHERVEKYGSSKLRHIFIGMDIESFCQEYECHHIDESVAYIPMSLINQCVFRNVTDDIFNESDENAEPLAKNPIEERHPGIKFGFYDSIEAVMDAIKVGDIKGRFIAGFDVGRKHHTAEFILAEEISDDMVVVRFRRSFRNEKFVEMESEIDYAIRNAHVRKLGIDATGMGMHLAENLSRRYPSVVDEVNFTPSWKDESASNLRRLMENQCFAFPDDRDFRKQFHSIKRSVTDHGNIRVDAEKNKDHHGDIFWAAALVGMHVRNKPLLNYSVNLHNTDSEDRQTSSVSVMRPDRRIFLPASAMVQRLNSSRVINFGLKVPNLTSRREHE